MNEARFVEMTAELLQADRRYRRKMLEVLQTFADPKSQKNESTPEHSIRESETLKIAATTPVKSKTGGNTDSKTGIRYY